MYEEVNVNYQQYPVKDLCSIGQQIRKDVCNGYFVSSQVGTSIKQTLKISDMQVVKHCIDAMVIKIGSGNDNKSVRHHLSVQLWCSLQNHHFLFIFFRITKFWFVNKKK